MKVYWGDLHCHCAASYGKGTPARALDVARQHLDFCSLTGHAFWPDMPMDLRYHDRTVQMHLGGFAKLQYYWKDLMRASRGATVPGRFAVLPSYEWHSMEFGDYNCYFKSFDVPLIDAPNLKALVRKLKRGRRDFMMLPHHVGYVRGHRGMNWGAFDERVSPLIEMYSGHGCSEADDAPYEYFHTMGPRVSTSTVRAGLLAGRRFGFSASTDNHDGYPGYYGHGVVGVMASRLDAASIWRALRARRTIASTGARIVAAVRLGSGSIGQVVARKERMRFRIDVEGTAPIDKVEVVESSGKSWRVRRLPMGELRTEFQPGRYKVKVEAGWGGDGVRTDWHVAARVRNGRLLGCEPCFRYGSYEMDEERSAERIEKCTAARAVWTCRTVPNPGPMVAGTQAVVLDVEFGRTSRLQVDAGDVKLDVSARRLVEGSVGAHVDGFRSPALKVHRAIPEQEFRYSYEETYEPLGDEPGFLYVRISQIDGQVAWTSPIWFE